MNKEMRREVDRHVGRRLRVAREFRGYSQNELSKEIDLSFQQVQKYERGDDRISAGLIYDLSHILKLPLAYFYKGLPQPPAKIEKQEVPHG